MTPWQAVFFGLKQIPRELTAFEIEAFFTFTATERRVIEQRRQPALKLGLALQIGFLRMSGRVLDAVRVVPAVLWRHLGEQFNVAAPDLASLRAMYGRGSTRDRQQLRLLIMHERCIRSTIVKARQQYEVALAKSIHVAIDDERLAGWGKALVTPRESGVTLQSWLWAPPAKHSTRQIEELLERIGALYELGIHRHFADVPDDLLRRYARRLADRPPSIGARIKEPLRTIESAYFLRHCLLIGTDRLLLMVRRRVADLWRHATTDANRVLIHWADLYRELLSSVATLASDTTVADSEVRVRLRSLVAEHLQRKPPTRAQLVRDHLTLEIRPVRSLLSALMVLPWEATAGHKLRIRRVRQCPV